MRKISTILLFIIATLLLQQGAAAQGLLKKTVVAAGGSGDFKTILKNCKFDGYEGFMLGRYHREAQFFLIDCNFSKNMIDKAIYRVPTNNVINWGERIYYYNCHRSGGNDFDWHKDNLPAGIAATDITVNWLFRSNWNPLAN